jgi:hypothetical protein
MTAEFQPESSTLPSSEGKMIRITYYRKIPHMGTVTGPIIVSAGLLVDSPYQLNSLFITELAREQIPDFDRLVYPEGFNTPAANERLTRLHLL